MKKKKILIIVDHPQRDLDAIFLLSNHLSKYKNEIYLISQYDFHLVPFVEPDLIVLHHGRLIVEGGSGNDIITGGDGRNSQELLEICRDSTDRELQTWNYIAKLIELDNKEEISNIEVLKELIKINKNGE